MSGSHLTDDTLLFYRFGTLEADAVTEVAEHLRTCLDCANRYARLGSAVERFETYDVDGSVDDAQLAQARQQALDTFRARPPRAPTPVPAAAPSPVEATPPQKPAKVEKPKLPWPGLAAWLGLKPGAGYRPLRLTAVATLAACVAWLTGGSVYFATRGPVLNTTVIVDHELTAGAHTSVHVTTNQPNTPTLVEFVTSTSRTSLFEGTTQADGTLEAPITVPQVDDPTASIVVTTSGRERDVASAEVIVTRKYSLHVGTDKPMYQPGQTIHVRALAMRAPAGTPAAGQPLTFEVKDARGVSLMKKTVQVSKWGIASTDLELSSDVALGTWLISATTESVTETTQVDVARYTLPKFKLSVAPDKTSYLAGERLRAHLTARYFFGKPVAKAQVHALLLRGEDQSLAAEITAKTDGDGTAELETTLPASLAREGQPELVTLELEVKDNAGQVVRSQHTLTVARELLTVEIVGENPVRNAESTFFVVTSTPDGQPVACSVNITTPDGTERTVRTSAAGLAQFTFQPTGASVLFHVRAEDDLGRRTRREISVPLSTDRLAPLTSDRALYRPGDTVSFSWPTSPQPVELTALSRTGNVVGRTTIVNGLGSFRVPENFAGTLTFDGAPSPKRVLVVRPSTLNVKVSTTQNVWRPGEEATVNFEVTDAQGHPSPAALGLAVVDESLFALVGDQAAATRASMLVEKALQQPHHGISGADFVASSTWSDEAQLAARYLLAVDSSPLRHAPTVSRDTFAENAVRRERKAEHFRDSLAGIAVLVALIIVLGASVRLPALASMALVAAIIGLIRFDLPLVVLTAVYLLAAGGVVFAYHRAHGRFPFAFVIAPLLLVAISMFGLTLKSSARTPITALAMRGNRADDGSADLALNFSMPVPTIRTAAPSVAAKLEKKNQLDRVSEFVGANQAPEPPRRQVRVREHFPETMYVNPQLVLDEQGKGELKLPLADSITTWRLSALASGADGAIGSTVAPLKVFQGFFVDLETPAALVRGDQATIPVAIYNYHDQPQDVRLEVEAQPWFELIGPSKLTVSLAAGAVEGRSLRIRVREPGDHTLTVRADGTNESDVVARRLLVSEVGREASASLSGELSGKQAKTFVLTIPPTAVGASRLAIKVSSSVTATALDGIEGTIAQPHGCFEQTSATTYPNALVSQFLQKQGRLSPQLEATLQRYLTLGYQRLVGYEVPGGGFEWFGRAPANKILTAYGLMEFADMAKVSYVDPVILERTKRFLVARQRPDGAWDPDEHSLSDGLFRSQHTGRITVTAYLAWALAEAGGAPNELAHAQTFLYESLSDVDDPYTLALIAASYAKSAHPKLGDAISALMKKAKHDGELLSFAPAGATAYYGRGTAGEVETTAIAASALITAGHHAAEVKGLVSFLLAQRMPHGGWASTQATILSLKTLLSLGSGSTGSGAVNLKLNGVAAGTFTPNETSGRVFMVDTGLHVGANIIELTAEEDAPFIATANYTVPWRAKGDADHDPLALEVDYGVRKVEVGGVVPVDVTLTYRGDQPSGMALIELGLPAGLTAIAEDLETLKTTRVLARTEIAAGSLRLYVDRLVPKALLHFALRFKAASPVDTKGVGSNAFLFYEPTVRAQAAAVPMLVR